MVLCLGFVEQQLEDLLAILGLELGLVIAGLIRMWVIPKARVTSSRCVKFASMPA